MKKLLLAALCLSAASAMSVTAQSLSLKGRVLDKANMKGVPGATVKVVGSADTAVTDTAGRFTLPGTTDISGRFIRSSAEPYFRGGSLFVEAVASGQSAHIEIFGATGSMLAAADHALKAGWNRIDALPAGTRDFLGFARIKVGGETWVKRMLHTSGPVSATWLSGSAPAAARGLAKAAAGEVEVSADKLVKKTVAYTGNASDLGDIVLDYPARKLGVGAEPIYGAVVLFGGSKGRAAAAAEMQANWKDWPRFEPSEIKFRITRDPQFPTDTNRATMQSCCNKVWGYDDIQATTGIFQDCQLHVEFIGMGEYDTPYDLEAPNSNSADGTTGKGYVNSGVYIASRYEIQIQSWTTDPAKLPGAHDMGAIVDATTPTSNQNKANGVWQAYDITFRGGRFNGKTMTTNPYVSVWWNGVQVHNNKLLNAAASGLSNHSGEEHLDPTVYGLKLQSEGRDVRFRNVWIKQLTIPDTQTNFGY
ncbi:MAG TPA: family 16 glycoside hydrolase [Fibrobacteria bacterium]|nr:family 16 glycoside hydrolase [Fibrobacteria bacterium]